MGATALVCVSNVAHMLLGAAPGFWPHGAPAAAHPCAALTRAILDLTGDEGYTEVLCCFFSDS